MKLKKLWVVSAGFLIAGFLLPNAHSAIFISKSGPAHLSLSEDAGVYSVKAFGATGNGKTLDTPAINKAIEAAAAAGGGTVRFPAGNYLSVSIHLKSNIALYLDQGATLIAASPADGVRYDPAEPNEWEAYQDFGHSHWHNSLIWGENLSNVSILGPGMIWGKGLVRGGSQSRTQQQNDALNSARASEPKTPFGYPNPRDAVEAGWGNKSISLKLCRNVIIRDVTILHGGHFAILATGVDNLTIDNLKIDTNRDGIDVDACKNVRISNCTVNSPFDDGICPKSSFALGYARATENVTISNITMRDVSNSPIFLRLGSRVRGPQGTPIGALRRVNINNVIAYNAEPRYASIISGIPGHDIEDLSLSNIRVYYKGGGTKAQAGLEPPEKENDYPEPTMFGEIPAYGFFIRHVRGLEMSDVAVTYLKDDARSAFILSDAKAVDLRNIKARHGQGLPSFILKDSEDFSLQQSQPLPDTKLANVKRHQF